MEMHGALRLKIKGAVTCFIGKTPFGRETSFGKVETFTILGNDTKKARMT